MSSMRNSLHRRNHKERGQLARRARLGPLEKHKDYVLRARDYASKRARIQRLRQKAADRNKDEFYFSMTRERTRGGVHVKERGNEALPADVVKVLKTQDENYVRTMRSAGVKKIDRLKEELSVLADLTGPSSEGLRDDKQGALDDGEVDVLREAGILPAPVAPRKRKSARAAAKHVIFVDDAAAAREEAMASTSNPVDSPYIPEPLASNVVDLGWKVVAPKKSKKGKEKAAGPAPAPANDAAERKAAAAEHRGRLLKELSARLTRDRQLRYAGRELEMQRLLLGKGGRRKLRGVEKVEGEEDDEGSDDDAPRPRAKAAEQTYRPRVYKWRAERKK